ncbi:hypothetical protein PG999_013989 [Apiospora kogelbergensis]|uniref:Uncharacterized protein n=1 Tax=Apiospora kogelbergensis TaxID=1337665 RepID=A0AAW0QGV2_9PEZI
MRSSLLFATAAAFLAPVQAQAKAPSKAVASFYHNEGSCDDADLGAEVTMFDSGNATVRADARAFYTILYAKTDPACTVEYVVDWTRMKWNSNQKRDEAVSSLANVDVDVKDLHVITWGKQQPPPLSLSIPLPVAKEEAPKSSSRPARASRTKMRVSWLSRASRSPGAKRSLFFSVNRC